jgi:hypothetical protein
MEQFRKDVKPIKSFFKEHWLTVSVIVILLLGSAILISGFKHPPENYPANSNWADKIFNFLDEWASAGGPLFAFIGIFAALFIGIKSLLQTGNIQSIERKELLLNEIIEWAEESVKSAIYRQTKDEHELWKAILDYKYCIAKSEYIKVIATSSFSTLTSLIDDVVTNLNNAMKGTINYKDSGVKDNNKYENHKLLLQYENELTESTKPLFSAAAKIKSELLK